DGAALMGTTGSGAARPSGDQTPIRFWDVATGRPLPPVPGLEGAYDLVFSPDARMLAVDVHLPGGRTGGRVPMEIRVFELSAEPVTRETRGEPAAAPEPAPAPPAGAAVGPVEELKRECAAADAGFIPRFQAAKSDAERQQIAQERLVALEPCIAGALDLARRHPQDDTAVEALEFALHTTAGVEGKLGERGAEAVALVRRLFLTSEKLDRLVPWLAVQNTPPAEELLRDAWEKSPHRPVRGRAGFHLAGCLTERAEAARLLKQMPDPAHPPHVPTPP